MGKDLFDQMGEKWQSAGVARTETGVFSGGVLSPKTMANLDSQGLGPEGRISCGRKILYPVDNLISWMRGRAKN